MPPIISRETGTSYLGVGAAAIIFDDAGRVLLIKENYGQHRYGPPGGEIEDGESPMQAVIREVREEVCVDVGVDYLVGVYFRKANRRGWPSRFAAISRRVTRGFRLAGRSPR